MKPAKRKFSPWIPVSFILGAAVMLVFLLLWVPNQLQLSIQPAITNTSTTVRIASRGGEVDLVIDPIPGVPVVTSESMAISDGLFDEDYYPVPWLYKSTTTPPGLKEYRDPKQKVRFLYPEGRGKLQWDEEKKEFSIRSNYHIDDWYPVSFRIKFSEVQSTLKIGSWLHSASPSYFCAKRLAPSIPLGGIHGCYAGKESDGGIWLTAVVHGWDNDAGYAVVEAEAELTGRTQFQSVNVQLEYSSLETDIDSQTVLAILDSIRLLD